MSGPVIGVFGASGEAQYLASLGLVSGLAEVGEGVGPGLG